VELALPLIFLLTSGRFAYQKVLIQIFIGGGLFAALWKLKLHSVALAIEFVPCFLAGVLAFALSQRFRGLRISGWWWGPVVVFVLLVASVVLRVQLLPPVSKEWLVCGIVGWLIPQFREIESNWIARSAHLIAKYSYGIYLSHVPIMWLCATQLHGSYMQRTLAAGALSIVVPVLLYHLVEGPMISLGRVVTRNATLAAYTSSRAVAHHA
jgi:peptidoglycan/LPS O-acetylase OafA/YrhL